MQKKSWILFGSILGIVLISAFVLGAKPGDNQDSLLQLILDELTEIKTIANGMTILLQEINSKNETINVNVEAPPITIQEDNSMTKRGNILVQNLDNSKQIPFYVSLPNGNCSIMLSTDEVITNTMIYRARGLNSFDSSIRCTQPSPAVNCEADFTMNDEYNLIAIFPSTYWENYLIAYNCE